MRSSSRRTRRATSTVFLPDCLATDRRMPGRPLMRAMRVTLTLPSDTRATWARGMGLPWRTATTVSRSSSRFSYRAEERRVRS